MKVTESAALALLLLFAAKALTGQPVSDKTAERPRLVILTDIGGDPDDQQSMVRLLTYANEFEIEGLIASASGTPGELKQNVVRPDLIQQTVDAYAQVRENLRRHTPGYPTADQLQGVIKSGNPLRGERVLGEGNDTEGSNWIISIVDRADRRPVNIAVWGGPTDLAQALWRVKNTRSDADVRRFVSKLRVHAIGHQDDAGPWIVSAFPDLFYIVNTADPNDVSGRPQTGPDRRKSVYRGMYLGGDESLTSREWIETNVRTHGPLGALYPTKTWTAPNPHGTLKEGDTPSWFYFLPLGLNDPQHPEWGGWGGRFRKLRANLYSDAPETLNGTTDPRFSVSRWRPAFQNDFAARMDWCVNDDRKAANHPPQAVLNSDRSRDILNVSAKSGERIRLNAAGSGDSDGQKLSYRWYVYPEAGSYDGALELLHSSLERAELIAPVVSEPRTIHIVLEVTDNGQPALTSYRRSVITIQPAQR